MTVRPIISAPATASGEAFALKENENETNMLTYSGTFGRRALRDCVIAAQPNARNPRERRYGCRRQAKHCGARKNLQHTSYELREKRGPGPTWRGLHRKGLGL